MKYLYMTIFLFLFSLSFVSAQPPFQVTETINKGIQIQAPVIQYHEIGQDFEFIIHAHNGSDGLILQNDSINCTIHIYKDNGKHIVANNMIFKAGFDLDFDLEVDGGNFTEVGQYSVIFYCESIGEIGGFFVYGFDVTYTGDPIPTGFDGRFILLLCFVLLAGGLAYLQKTINFDKWYQGILNKYNNRNFFRTFISKLGFFFMNNPFSLFYMIGLFIMLLMYDITRAYVLESAYQVMQILVMIYLFGMFFLFIELLGDIHEFFSKIAEDIKAMGWGMSGDSGLLDTDKIGGGK